MPLRTLFGRLGSDQDGAAGILVAGSAFALAAAASVGVDVGSIYLAKRQLQGVADAAAMSAAASVDADDAGFSQAQAMVARSGDDGVAVTRVTPGVYTRDPTIAPGQRFAAGWSSRNAARVTVEQDVPLFFARVLTGSDTTHISADATAATMNLAAFSLGTRLASFSGGIAGQMLNALAGTDLGLGAADMATLESASVGLLNLGDALRQQLGLGDVTYSTAYNRDIPLDTLLNAMAAAAPDQPSRALLESLATKVGSQTINLSALVDLGPLGSTDYNDGKSTVSIDALSLIKGALELSHGDTYDISFSTNVAGVASTQVRIAGSSGDVHSPMLTVTAAKDVVLRTGAARVYVEANVLTGLSTLASVHLPLYVELAASQARLADIRCGQGQTSGVTLAVTPSIGSAAIGDINGAQFDDFSTAMPVTTAALASALGTKVTGYSNISLGGVSSQNVFFTRDEVAAKVTKTVATNDLVAGVASSLVSKMSMNVTTPLGALPSPNVITKGLGSTLSLVAPSLDGLLDSVTQAVGIQLGLADVRVDHMRCGMPILI